MASLQEAEALCAELLAENGYMAGKVLPDGSIAVMLQLMTTTAICLGVTRDGWSRRFCFKDFGRCLGQYVGLQSEDDELTGWVARRPEQPCDRFTSSSQSSLP